MILNLDYLKERYNLNIKGVLHIGAHIGQEYKTYERLGINNVMFFEPISSTFNKLKENLPTASQFLQKQIQAYLGL